jgi:hypothetical protein
MKTARLALLALLVSASALFAADDYVIRLTRPSKVGDRVRIDARGSTREQERITVGDQVQKDDKDLSVHLVAAATILAVDSKADATRIEYLIESCQKTSAGKTEEVLPAGKRVVAESNAEDETVFTVDGDPALEDISKALAVVISAHTPGAPTDDEIFGTSERKRVGDTWTIHTATTAAYLSKAGLKVSPENLKGTVSLDAAKTVGSVKALALSAHLSAQGMTMDAPDFMQLEKSSMKGEFNALVPVDPDVTSYLPSKLTMQIVFKARGQKPDTGSPVTIEETMDMSVETSYQPLKPEPQPVEF